MVINRKFLDIEKSVATTVSWIDTTLSRVMLAISEKVIRYGLAVHTGLVWNSFTAISASHFSLK